MTRHVYVLLSFLPFLFFVSCATMPYEPQAREIKRKPQQGGAIALNEKYRAEDRAKADNLMKSNCGTNKDVAILEEGEVVVGEKVDSTAKKTIDNEENTAFKLGGIRFTNSTPAENVNTSMQKTQIKEWRIEYGCIASIDTAKPTAKKKHKKPGNS